MSKDLEFVGKHLKNNLQELKQNKKSFLEWNSVTVGNSFEIETQKQSK